MKKQLLLLAAILVFGLSGTVQAAFHVRGTGTIYGLSGEYQLIYDDVEDVTWLDYTEPPNSWYSQRDLALFLDVTFGGQTYEDWRVPYLEMSSILPFYLTGDTDPFQNVSYTAGTYWTSEETTELTAWAWTVWIDEEMWLDEAKGTDYAALFVRDGDVVPIPGAVWLLGSGLIGLVGIRIRLKK
jgi:hypothetical protein